MTAPRRRISLSCSRAHAQSHRLKPRAPPSPQRLRQWRRSASFGQRTVKPRAPPGPGLDARRGLRPEPRPISRLARRSRRRRSGPGGSACRPARADSTAHEPHAAFLDDARGEAPRLEEAGAPQPDIDPAAVFRHEGARPARCTRLRLRRRVRRSAGFVSAASAANGSRRGQP